MENPKHSETEMLLKDQRVIDEIQRHLWIESEKAGHDIGFDAAREDWLKRFSKAWMAYNLPQAIAKSAKTAESSEKKSAKQPSRKRHAKSYI